MIITDEEIKMECSKLLDHDADEHFHFDETYFIKRFPQAGAPLICNNTEACCATALTAETNCFLDENCCNALAPPI
jgi:hypothetical protein